MRTFAIAALLCSVALPAHAGISCNLNDQRNNTLSYTFARGGQGYTNEISVRRNGVVISNGGPMWSRNYHRAQKIMSLEQAGWVIEYEAHASETETSAAVLSHNGNRVAIGVCYADHSMDTPAPTYTAPEPTPAPTYTPPDPTPAPTYASTGDAVPFIMEHGAIKVRVNLPGYWAKMTLDTGAGMGSVTSSLADKLIADGHATEQVQQRFCMANGSCDMERVIMIDWITVGSHTVNNVRLSVTADGVEMLLGLPVLNAIGKFTIDSANHQLTFG